MSTGVALRGALGAGRALSPTLSDATLSKATESTAMLSVGNGRTPGRPPSVCADPVTIAPTIMTSSVNMGAVLLFIVTIIVKINHKIVDIFVRDFPGGTNH